MIPTPHLRLWTDALHKPPVLQQLWISVKTDESHDMERIYNWTPQELEVWRECYWRTIPTIHESPSK